MVDNELTFTLDDLLERATTEADVTLSCVSNRIGGDLIGNARWTGVPLQDLLDEAGVQPGGTQIMSRSVDDFTAGFPISLAGAAGCKYLPDTGCTGRLPGEESGAGGLSFQEG